VDDGQRCDASPAIVFGRQTVAVIDNAGSFATDRVRDMHGVPKLCQAPSYDVLGRLPDAVAQGLEVSLGGFL